MSPTADVILLGGRIHTCDEQAGTVQALAIKGRHVQAIGRDAEVSLLADHTTRRVELNGRCVIPGMTDGHAHMDREGLRGQLPSLGAGQTLEEVLDAIADATRRVPDGEWIVTQPMGLPPEYVPGPGGIADGRIPNRHDLDRVSPRHPVYIRSIWGYWRNAVPLVSVANSLALKLAGIDEGTRAPSPDVRIEVDLRGCPTGVFREDTLVPVVEHTLMRCAPGFSASQRLAGLLEGMERYNAFGTTAIFEGHGVAEEVMHAYRTAREMGRATVRGVLTFSPNWQIRATGEAAEMLNEYSRWAARQPGADAWLRTVGLYAEVDADPLNNRLRAANAPCTGWAGFQSGCALPQEVLQGLAIEAARAGIRLAGIWPNLLPIFERANRAHSIHALRWVWGHQSVLDSEQIARVAELGLAITTHTNRHIYKDGLRLLQRHADRPEDIVPLRRLLDAGVQVSFGSDNLPPSLFGPMAHATNRLCREGTQIAPAQAISRAEALGVAVRGGAWLCGDETVRGRLVPGHLADLCVLSGDPLSCEEAALPAIRAQEVFVDGLRVFPSCFSN